MPGVQEKRNVSKEMGLMSVVFKYIGIGLMLVFLGIIGVGVFLYYIVLRIFEGGDSLEVETDDWGDVDE